MSLKGDLDQVNQTVFQNSAQLRKEAEDRESTDNLLMELFQSVLDILADDVGLLSNLEKKGDQIERANLHIFESKVDDELQATKKLLDSHSAQLSTQKAQLLDFNSVEAKLNDIEFRLTLETARSEYLTNFIHANNFHKVS